MLPYVRPDRDTTLNHKMAIDHSRLNRLCARPFVCLAEATMSILHQWRGTLIWGFRIASDESSSATTRRESMRKRKNISLDHPDRYPTDEQWIVHVMMQRYVMVRRRARSRRRRDPRRGSSREGRERRRSRAGRRRRLCGRNRV